MRCRARGCTFPFGMSSPVRQSAPHCRDATDVNVVNMLARIGKSSNPRQVFQSHVRSFVRCFLTQQE